MSALGEIVARNFRRRRREAQQRLEEAHRRLEHRRQVRRLDKATDPREQLRMALEIAIKRLAALEGRAAFAGAVTESERHLSRLLDMLQSEQHENQG